MLVRFAPYGAFSTLLGEPGGLLATGVPHGLRLEHDVRSFLYYANNAQRLTKTMLHSQVIWSTDVSNWEWEKPQFWPVQPTDAIVVLYPTLIFCLWRMVTDPRGFMLSTRPRESFWRENSLVALAIRRIR